MRVKLQKIAIFSILFFTVGFLGGFLGKSFEKSKLGKKVEKKLGIIPETPINKNLAQTNGCAVSEQNQDNSAMFIGCNGFF